MSKTNPKREAIKMALEDRGLTAVLIDGFDSCIIGTTDLPDGGTSVCYDTAKIIRELRKQGMTHQEAIEYFDFNIEGAKFSGGNPTFIDTL